MQKGTSTSSEGASACIQAVCLIRTFPSWEYPVCTNSEASLTSLTPCTLRQSRQVVLYVPYYTVFTLSIRTPYHTCPKFWRSILLPLRMCLKYGCLYAKQCRPWSDSAVSDLHLHCLQRPFCPNTEGYYAKTCADLSKVAGENCLSRKGKSPSAAS